MRPQSLRLPTFDFGTRPRRRYSSEAVVTDAEWARMLPDIEQVRRVASRDTGRGPVKSGWWWRRCSEQA